MVGLDDRRPLWVWENEGGARAAPKPDRAVHPRRYPRRPQDTPEGCNAMAAADMARAGREPKGWGRTRYEHSAVMWARRAQWLKEGGVGPRAN